MLCKENLATSAKWKKTLIMQERIINGMTKKSSQQANLWASWQDIFGLNVYTNILGRASELNVLDATFKSFLCHRPRRTFNKLIRCGGPLISNR